MALLSAVVPLWLSSPAAHAANADGRDDGHIRHDGLIRDEVTFRGGAGLPLHGTVVAPASPSPHKVRAPGIVLLGGSGPGPRTEYRQEADAFARSGIVTLVFDKRTVGYSTLHVDFGLLADDALAGVRLLRSRAGVDPSKVGLWGFSEGGWVAPLAAARSGDVAYVITLGGSGLNPLRTQTWNLTTHLRHRRITGSFPDAVAGPTAQLLHATGKFPEGDYDPSPVLARLRQPVLALWGVYDNQVPPAESARIFRETLGTAGNRHVTIRFLPGAAHNGHRTTDGFDRLGGPRYAGKRLGALASGSVDTMASWVRAVAAGKAPSSSASPAPREQVVSAPLPGGTGYEVAALALLSAGFAGYAVTGFRRPATRCRPARPLAALGLTTVVGTLLCTLSVYVAGEGVAAPVIAGRPLAWLLLQLCAVGVLALTAVTAASAWRHRDRYTRATRTRLLALVTTGALFLPWALHWGLLAP
ncbi:alpha/beta hydrolase [Streptomyces gilvosporeus]|uniref:Alpha/beta hydrolase n=2 Tax=Streptomyces gilvosporeus TaxID=553510 RepID=A0A1V0U414_9ACTN|nr:alpha/beta hydrolase [Streptomyces gilvosporeus]